MLKYWVPPLLAAFILLSLFIFLDKDIKQENYKIGILIASEGRYEKVKGLMDELQNLGFEEGRNIQLFVKSTNNRQQIEPLAKQLISEELDLIVTAGGGETLAIKHLKPDIPIIFIGVASPYKWGLVSNEMNNQITGVVNGQIELIPKRFELMLKLNPRIENILILADKNAPPTQVALEEVQKYINKAEVQVEIKMIETERELNRIIKDSKNIQAIFPLPSFILEEALIKELPSIKEKGIFVMGAFPEQVEKGMHVAYGSSFYEQGAQAAHLAAKILWGQNVESIPIEHPNSYQLKANYDSLTEIGWKLDDMKQSIFDEIVYLGVYIK